MPLTDESMWSYCFQVENLKFFNCSIFSFRAVVRELIETEEEFGRDLLLVVEHYMKILDNPKTPKKVSDNKDIIFGNFKQIAEFHNT